jgi:4-aminobutyrate aminotransferase-like enzyme
MPEAKPTDVASEPVNPTASTQPTSTEADALRSDPRVAQAKALLQEVVAEHSSQLSDVRAADPSLKDHYERLLAQAAAARGGALLWPYLSSGLGNGPYVQLADGSVKLDFIGGIGVYGSGHSHLGMIDAAIDAAIEDVAMQGNLQQHPPSIRISERLIQLASADGAPLTSCMLSTSGAMANENALKLAFHKATPASRILAFDNAFAGRSLALASITDRPKYRQGLPLALNVDYLPALDVVHPEQSQQRAVEQLHRLLARHPGRYAAFWGELIAGEGGYYPSSHEFFAELCEPIRAAGIPIIFDEVQSFARTSRPFAFQHYRLDQYADIVTVGKITQVCATLYRETFKPTAPIISQTFTGATSSISVGMTMLDLLRDSGCFGDNGWNVRRHLYFADGLSKLSSKYPQKIRGPYGEGMMIAFTPGDGSYDQAKALMDIMFDEGLLGFLCGSDPTRVRFLPPPAITTEAHIDAALALLDRSLTKFAIAS